MHAFTTDCILCAYIQMHMMYPALCFAYNLLDYVIVNKMADAGYDCRKLFLGIYLLCFLTGLILLYAILLTICTCFLCRRLLWYARNSGRELPIVCRRINASCPPRRVCAVELMCCCFGCKIAPPMEENIRSAGKPCLNVAEWHRIPVAL